MNAAARLVHQNTHSYQLILTYLLGRWQAVTLMVGLSVLVSALSIIYVTHSHRLMYADYQHTLAEHDRLQVERGQLLLEQSAFLMQTRIHQVAEKKLGMVAPDYRSLIVVKD